MFENSNSTPIYLQLTSWLEDEIIKCNLVENERIYSQYSIADMFNVNPATGAKALNILADEGLVYKKRGIGMFVEVGARDKIIQKRKEDVFTSIIDELIKQAKFLNVSKDEIVTMLNNKMGEDEK